VGRINALAHHLERIRQAYPVLAVTTARPVTEHGQNNDILVVDERLIFRFPRYPSGIPALARTVRILHAIRSALPLAIPDSIYSSFEDGTVGKVFVGYSLIPGEPLWIQTFEGLPTEGARQRLVDQLAEFLRVLHSYPVDTLLPDQVAAFDPLAQWQPLYERIRASLFAAMRPGARDHVARHFETFLGDRRNQSIRPSLTHGDFGTSNILYDRTTGSVVGVVDFDSTGVGDPAIDLAAASCYGLHRFGRYSTHISEMIRRIDFYRGTFALQEALFGAENGDEAAYRSGMAPYI
jgi:aminoglycoside 2''-phosphotransferase